MTKQYKICQYRMFAFWSDDILIRYSVYNMSGKLIFLGHLAVFKDLNNLIEKLKNMDLKEDIDNHGESPLMDRGSIESIAEFDTYQEFEENYPELFI